MLLKNYTTPSGANTTFHIVKGVEPTALPSDVLNVIVASFATQADYLTGKSPIWHSYLTVPWTALGPNIERSMCVWLVADTTGTFFGGNVIAAYSADPLEFAQNKQWQIIKARRALEIANIDMDLSQATVNNLITNIKTRAADLKAAILAATTVEQVESIIW